MDQSMKQFSSYKIEPQQYKILQIIGAGHFGSAYLAQDIATGNYCALKQIPCQMMNPIQQEYLNREIEIMAQVTHPALLGLKGYSTPFDSFQPNDNMATIIMDFMENGSLFDVLQLAKTDNDLPYWNQTTKNKMLIGISSGMKYLHNMKIIHRDLKPENILLDKNFEPKITDFGLSKVIDRTYNANLQKNTPNIGTPLYMPPEIFSNQPYSFKVDVFAFAILSYEIITGLPLYPEVTSPIELGVKICNGERLSIPDDVPSDFKNLISRCWAQDPKQRPTFDEIYSFLIHPNTFLPGADLNHLNAYKNKIREAETKSKSNSATKWKVIEDQLSMQEKQMKDLQKSLQELMINSKKNNEILRNNLSTVRNERTIIEHELKNSFQKNNELIQLISQQHHKIKNELSQLSQQILNENNNPFLYRYESDQDELIAEERIRNKKQYHRHRAPPFGNRPSSLQLDFHHPITQLNNNTRPSSFTSDQPNDEERKIDSINKKLDVNISDAEWDDNDYNQFYVDFGNLDNIDDFDQNHDSDDHSFYNCFDSSSDNLYCENEAQTPKSRKKKKENLKHKTNEDKNGSTINSSKKSRFRFPRRLSKINSHAEVIA